MGQDQVSGGVGVLCWLVTPVAMFYGNLQNLVIKVKIGNKVQFGNKFANWCNVWSIECAIVYGHVPECHVTFGRGRLHNIWWDPHIDHKTFWGTISNVPWHIPVRGALMKVAPTKCLWRWEPDRRSNFFFSPPAHLCAVTYMTEFK